LAKDGVAAHGIEEITGFPALFGGRVKTLHPALLGGILFDRSDAAQVLEAKERGIVPFSVVAVTLYPPPEIDIGGVALLRAAAKNSQHVTVLSDPAQYSEFIASLPSGGPAREIRRRLAVEAFRLTSAYDSRNAETLDGNASRQTLELNLPLRSALRYGENPQELGAFYAAGDLVPEQLHGKTLSYNNLLDLDATLRVLSRSTNENGVRAVVVKHTIPCGVAQRSSVSAAVQESLDADRISAYGGIAAVDAKLDGQAARLLSSVFLEIVAAPDYEVAALEILRRKKDVRVMRFPKALPGLLLSQRTYRSALGGVLVEEPNPAAAPERMRVVSHRQPTDAQWRDVLFAWDVVRHVKSNGIVIAKDEVTRGICAGQTNRVSAVEIAGRRAGALARGAACASDGFFPFADGLEAAIAAGCDAVIAPGGSIRDAEVIAAADRAGIALVFSTHRHFLH
jgi:phosphoribosylaminoimidazolecarboxamide formyltransferase/IMP cyclohydrolase